MRAGGRGNGEVQAAYRSIPSLVVQILGILVAVPFLVRLDLWLFEQEVLNVRPVFLLMMAFAPFVLSCALGAISRAVAEVRQDALSVVAATLLVGVIELIGVARLRDWPDDAQIALYYWLDLFTVLCGYSIGRVLGEWRRIRPIFVLALVVHTASVVLDWLFPGILSVSALDGRPAGFVINPNGTAFIAVTLLTALLAWNRGISVWREVWILALALVTIVLSGSRGGLLAALVVISLFLFRVSFYGSDYREMLKHLVAALAVGTMLVAVIAGTALLSESRLLEIADEGLWVNDASQERLLALETSWKLIAVAPWFGHGSGYSYTLAIGPHNVFLRTWIDHGIVGLAGYSFLYCSILLLAIMRRDWRIGSLAAAVFAMSMVSHNVIEDRTLLITFGILLSMKATDAGLARRATDKQKVMGERLA